MDEMDQLWPLRCRDRLVELKEVVSDGAQICGHKILWLPQIFVVNYHKFGHKFDHKILWRGGFFLP